MAHAPVIPAVLTGGAGTRLWLMFAAVMRKRTSFFSRWAWSFPFVVLIVGASAVPARAAELKSPFAAVLPSGAVAADKLAKCAPPPAPVVVLATMSRYEQEDPTKSTIDPERAAAYEATVKPLRDFQSEVVGWANDVVRRPKKLDKAGCAFVWLGAWAKGGALQSPLTGQSAFNRDQALAALALAYLQIRNVEPDDKTLRPAILDWLGRLANGVIDHYESEAGEMSRANNHRYFAALAVGATAIAVEDERFFAWAVDTLDQAVCGTDSSGALPMEMRRGPRARDYQIFAAGPLVMLAEIAERNGVNAYGRCAGGLHRIIDFGLRSIVDPSAIERLTGVEQVDFPGPGKRGTRLAWLAPYVRRFPQTTWAELFGGIDGHPSSTALGGNLALLYPDADAEVR